MFQELLYITTEIPDNGEYIYGYSYFVQVINPIPRFVWNGKPTFDSGLHLARLKGEVDPRTGELYLTRSPGLIGEMYMNFGLVGIVALSGLGGWLVRGWDRLPRRHGDSVPTLILYCMGLAVLFIMGRSFNMHMLYAILFLLVGFYLTTSFFDATGQRRSKPRAPNSSSPPQRMSGTRVFHRPSLGTASSDSQPPAGS